MISAERLAARFDALSKITTKCDAPGIHRLAFTDAERAACDAIMAWMREAGLTLRTDAFGNVIARKHGTDDTLPAVLFGSHADSVPSGGNYDGIVGILAAIEVMQSLTESGYEHVRPLEAVLFRCEESSRFSAATLGSRAMCGELTALDAKRLKDAAGNTLYDVLTACGHAPDRLGTSDAAYPGTPRAFLEVHIEQGKVLAATGTQIGIVTGIAAPTRLRVHLHGNADHSGATPMGLRTDGSCAAAEIILLVEALATAQSETGENATQNATQNANAAQIAGAQNSNTAKHADSAPVVGTVGVIDVKPGAMNVVPGEVTLGIDIRSISAAAKASVVAALRTGITEIAKKRHIPCDIELLSDEAPVTLAPEMVSLLTDICQRAGVTHRTMPSGAGHDAMHWAPRTPTGMLFIPCRGGISHNPAEHADLRDIVTVANLLEEAVKRLSQA